MINIPAAVRGKALATGAEQWLDDLPVLISDISRDWGVRVGRAYPDPTEAYVAETTLADGTPAVLKLVVPRPGSHASREISALRLAAGEGCVRLLRFDGPRGAMLLERLGPPLSELGLPMASRHEILCATAMSVWRPARGSGLPTGAQQAGSLMDFISRTWAELGRPCSSSAVSYALSCAAARLAAHDDARAVLVHGDVHQWNALAVPAGGFKLVDPDGLVAEPEYDLGVIMREDPVELMAGDPWDRARWLARRCGLDATAIWQWGAADRVATGLVCTQIGLQPVGSEMLAAAEYVVNH